MRLVPPPPLPPPFAPPPLPPVPSLARSMRFRLPYWLSTYTVLRSVGSTAAWKPSPPRSRPPVGDR